MDRESNMSMAIGIHHLCLIRCQYATSSSSDKKLESNQSCGNDSSTSQEGSDVHHLSEARPGECDPDSENPCCGPRNYCGHSAEYCSYLDGCVDYRIVRGMKRLKKLHCN